MRRAANARASGRGRPTGAPGRGARPGAAGPARAPGFLLALALFALAALPRLLLVSALPDAGQGHSVLLKGDAPVWYAAARALRAGRAYEEPLPLHPPATAWLARALWDGNAAGFHDARVAMALLGALVPALLFLVLVRSGLGARPAFVAGLGAALANGLIQLSSSLQSETPYLVLFVLATALVEPLRRRPRLALLVLFGVLHALLTLVRAEHALVVLSFAAALALARRTDGRPWLRPTLAALGLWLLALLPWQVVLFQRVSAFDRGAIPQDPGAVRAIAAVEERTAGVRWTPEAAARRDALPPFVRRSAAAFVARTVQHRGRDVVGADDVDVLVEAFGSLPEPVSPLGLVTVYGGLNFALANHAGATGGFARGPLSEPPPLAGGSERYPPELVAGLPPPNLAFEYLPHLALVNHGTARGLSWIASEPGAYVRLVGRKLARFAEGLATGLGWSNVPLGLSGVRRAVDLTVARGGAATAWRTLLVALGLAGLALGLARGATRAALVPWALFLAAKLATVVLFFGYARTGATASPVLWIGIALLIERVLAALERRSPDGRLPRPALGLSLAPIAIVLALDLWRAENDVTVTLDGRPVLDAEPFPPDAWADREIRVVPD